MLTTQNKRIVGLLIALLGTPLLLATSTAPTAGDKTAPPTDPRRWEEAVRGFEAWDSKNSVPENAVLFVGSSSIRLWATRDCFPKFPVINRGFGGSQISDVNHYVNRIVMPYRPKVIVFYAGDNDVAARKDPQRVSEDYRQFVGLVHAKLPKTRVIFIPIKPSLSRWSLWSRMKEANALILEFSKKDERLCFADTTTPMLGDDGKPRIELFAEDGLHLNSKGYELWTKVLTPLIGQALQD